MVQLKKLAADKRRCGVGAGGSASIIPVDIEGQYFLHEIPDVGGGSGTFAMGVTLEEAYVVTARIEHSCKVRYYLDLMESGGRK